MEKREDWRDNMENAFDRITSSMLYRKNEELEVKVMELEKLLSERTFTQEEELDKWLRFYREDILNGFIPKCSCGKRATVQTERGKDAQKNLHRPCNWGWYCKKCFEEGLELEREAMGYYDTSIN